MKITVDDPEYLSYMSSEGISRIDFDAHPGRYDFSLADSRIGIDIYWPWVYVVSGRNCPIDSLTGTLSALRVSDSPCKKACRFAEIESFEPSVYPNIQKGNAVWMSTETLSLYVPFGGRLIYQPIIPV